MLRKEQSSLVVKIMAGFIGLAFIGSLIIGVLPDYFASDSSKQTENNSFRDYEIRTEELEKALKENPEQANILFELGDVYYKWGAALEQSKKFEQAASKYEKASQVLKKSYELKSSVDLLTVLGNVSFDLASALKALTKKPEADARFQEAIDYYQKYLESNPNNSDVRTDMAIAYFERGDSERAISEFNKVLADNPRHANALFNLGFVSYQTGKKEEAAKAWKQYLEVDPNSPNAKFVQDRLKELEGKK